jgi:hypothetical protein
MSQQCTDHAKCYFLELPFQIRRRIYHEAGLLTGHYVHMNTKLCTPIVENSAHDEPSDRQYSIPAIWSLFTLCRSVHDETRRIFYGENRFVIARRMTNHLHPLQELGIETLREISSSLYGSVTQTALWNAPAQTGTGVAMIRPTAGCMFLHISPSTIYRSRVN